MDVPERKELLVWCNGGHYHAPGACPDSGWFNAAVNCRIDALPSRESVTDYASLIELGWSEDELGQVLVGDATLAEIAVNNRCSGPVDFAVADAVTERNRFLLDRFPGGVLARQLAEPERPPARYARKRGARVWCLVDLHLGYQPPTSTKAMQRVQRDLSKMLGVPWDEIERAAELEEYEVGEFRWGSLVIDDQLIEPNEEAERLRAERYPLIPAGHLDFFAHFDDTARRTNNTG